MLSNPVLKDGDLESVQKTTQHYQAAKLSFRNSTQRYSVALPKSFYGMRFIVKRFTDDTVVLEKTDNEKYGKACKEGGKCVYYFQKHYTYSFEKRGASRVLSDTSFTFDGRILVLKIPTDVEENKITEQNSEPSTQKEAKMSLTAQGYTLYLPKEYVGRYYSIEFLSNSIVLKEKSTSTKSYKVTEADTNGKTYYYIKIPISKTPEDMRDLIGWKYAQARSTTMSVYGDMLIVELPKLRFVVARKLKNSQKGKNLKRFEEKKPVPIRGHDHKLDALREFVGFNTTQAAASVPTETIAQTAQSGQAAVTEDDARLAIYIVRAFCEENGYEPEICQKTGKLGLAKRIM